jgi:pilus assembly protein Flp/PilA
MTALLLRFLQDRAGHTAIEYGMIAALVAILLITAMGSMGTSVDSMFEGIAAPFAEVRN